MNIRLGILILLTLVLIWNFVLFPSKIEFSDRAKVLQGVSLAKPYKDAIVSYWKVKGQLPTQEEWKLEQFDPVKLLDNSLVDSIIVSEEVPGGISVYFTNRNDPNAPAGLDGKKIVLTPLVETGEVTWVCKGTLTVDLLPVPCR